MDSDCIILEACFHTAHFKQYRRIYKWRFPEIGVPPVIIHFRFGFSLTKTIQLLGTPRPRETAKWWMIQTSQGLLATYRLVPRRCVLWLSGRIRCGPGCRHCPIFFGRDLGTFRYLDPPMVPFKMVPYPTIFRDFWASFGYKFSGYSVDMATFWSFPFSQMAIFWKKKSKNSLDA